MAAKRKTFICQTCGVETSATISNYSKQFKKFGFNRCNDCGKKAISDAQRKRYDGILKNSDIVEYKCRKCNLIRKIQFGHTKRNPLCKSCATKEAHDNRTYDASYTNRVGNDEFKQKVKAGNLKVPKEIKSKNGKNAASYWNDASKKEKQLKFRQSERYKAAMSNIWNTPGYREKRSEMQSILAKKLWQNDGYRLKVLKSMSNMSKVSSLAEMFYSILDDMDIRYYREHNDKQDDKECRIGWYSWDCVIPRDGRKTLLIDVNGDYRHSQPKTITKDQQKHTYITKHFSDQYEIKYIWEHEFKCKDKIQELIKYWIGITELELIDFDFKEIQIINTPAKDYKLLLSKYHYLPNAGRGGIAYGAYLGDELTAVCVFSPLSRQNININDYNQEEIRELSRLCIHPRYQKKNFASWFISRCIKQLDIKYKCIISYCDTTFNHNGAVYKAVGFKQDSIVPPDYWYVSDDGYVMHKKTLYNHAVQINMTEQEFVSKNSYTKVYGNKKLRFILERLKVNHA